MILNTPPQNTFLCRTLALKQSKRTKDFLCRCRYTPVSHFVSIQFENHHQHRQPLAAGGGGGGGRRGGCRGTTDVLMIFLQPSLSSASLRVLATGSSVHSLMLSCQHFFGLPRLLPPGTVPCMMVFASPVARVTCPCHLSLLVLTIERRSSCGPMVRYTPVSYFVSI